MESAYALTGLQIVLKTDTTSVPSDVALAQSGDSRAFERVYRMHVGRVYALCLRMAGSQSRAEELTQEIFVKTWSSLSSFRGESAFSTWLHRLAVNHILFVFRTDKRRESRVTAVDDPATLERRGHDAEPGNAVDVESALAGLPSGARLVILLHDVEGYKHEEIAEMLGVTSGTTKAQLHRARRLMRQVLEGDAS